MVHIPEESSDLVNLGIDGSIVWNWFERHTMERHGLNLSNLRQGPMVG